jgi:hypothetical protein
VQTNFAPILATCAKAQLDSPAAKQGSEGGGKAAGPADKHHPQLVELLAKELGVQVGDCLIDCTLQVSQCQEHCDIMSRPLKTEDKKNKQIRKQVVVEKGSST